MTWGHVVSTDLVHWRELGDAILPDKRGTVFSGSAVVDVRNDSGLSDNGAAVLCAFYTAAGRYAPRPQPFTQCLAYSLDGGRTWNRYTGNPVLAEIRPANRDPKVFWHARSKRWIMVLYVRRGAYSIFSSRDLRAWRFESEALFRGAYECPELFALPVDGNAMDVRWVLWSASGDYLIGRFDGKRFEPESDVLRTEWGPNFYAAQTWNNAPGGRRILIAWMRSDGAAYRGMPFNQQMTVPRELSLRRTEEGIRLFAYPVRELERLRVQSRRIGPIHLGRGQRRWQMQVPALLDVELELTADVAVSLDVRGVQIDFDAARGRLACLGTTIEGLPKGGPLELRMLVDRTSLEIFIARGRYVLSYCFPFGDTPGRLVLEVGRGQADVMLQLHTLRSIWDRHEAHAGG